MKIHNLFIVIGKSQSRDISGSKGGPSVAPIGSHLVPEVMVRLTTPEVGCSYTK